MTRNRGIEIVLIERLMRSRAGNDWVRPADHVWHDPGQGGTMQLVPFVIHGTHPHTATPPILAPGNPPRFRKVARPRLTGGDRPGGAALREFEDRIGVGLPEEYRSFLMLDGWGVPLEPFFPVGKQGRIESVAYFAGFDSRADTDLDSLFQIYSERTPEDTLPIAFDPFGNLVLIGIRGEASGQILFWDHEREPIEDDPLDINVEPVAPDFGSFIGSFMALRGS